MKGLLDIADEAITVHGAMQKRAELAGLLILARELRPKAVWEIGTASGGTLWALLRANSHVCPYEVVSIDLPGGPFSGGAQIEPVALRRLLDNATSGVPVQLRVIHGNSLEVALPETRPADLLLIDGDHSEAGVRGDWDRYAPLVNEGGLIALHDILPHPPVSGVEVAPVWAEIVASEPDTVEIVDQRPAAHGGQWGGIGVVFR